MPKLANKPTPATPSPGRWVRAGTWFREHYLTIDPRTVGFFRFVLGALVTLDFIRHWSYAATYYSNEGVLPNHLYLFQPASADHFSLFFAFSSLPEVHVAFALSALCSLLFCVGYKSRFFNVCAFVAVTSMHSRLILVENGGYIVENLLLFWAIFLPTGRRFSIDALLHSMSAFRETTTKQLGERQFQRGRDAGYVSLAVFFALLNLAVIYFFNVVNKSGSLWRAGETVHYVLHLDRMVTGLAVWARETLPMWLLKGATWSVLVVEASHIFLVMMPIGRRVLRVWAILSIFFLHLSFGTMMRLGPFSWCMIAWSTLLIMPVHWEGLARWFERRHKKIVVIYDRNSELAFWLLRLLVRLDSTARLSFKRSAKDETSPPLLSVELDDQVLKGSAAASLILKSLPAGMVLRPLAWVVTLGALPLVLTWVSHHRTGVARFFGLDRNGPHERAPSPTALRMRILRGSAYVREALLLMMGMMFVSQAINENNAVPKVMKHEQPKLVRSIIGYPRLFQGWGMFSPNPIRVDGVLAIDAYTVDGRRVDPLTGREPDLDLTDSHGEGLGQIPQDYGNRIRQDRNRGYRRGLKTYLEQWHTHTGHPEDELVAFDVYWVADECPLPGEELATNNDPIPILSFRKSGYRRPSELIPIPPSPRIRSAEKKTDKESDGNSEEQSAPAQPGDDGGSG